MPETAPFRTDLDLAGREVLVVGAGPAALPRIAGLRAAGAEVVVVAGTSAGAGDTEELVVADAITDLATRGLVRLHRRPAEPVEWTSAWIVAPATGDPAIDAGVIAQAATHRRLCLPPVSGTGTVDDLGRRTGDDPSTATAPPPDGRGGRVVLVGGGPGDPDLITVAGRRAVREADVVVTDRLAPLALLDEVRPGTEIVDVSKVPAGPTTGQDEINRILVDRGRAGKVVVRLKGGDGFVFGRGAEEWQACVAAGIVVEVVPGLSSAVAVPGLAGIPLTHRDLNQGFTVVSGHVRPDDPRSILDWAALARTGTALVVLMGVRTLPAISRTLIEHGLPADTPAATIADGGLPGQRVVRAPLDRIAQVGDEAGIRPPAITVIGSVAGFDPQVG